MASVKKSQPDGKRRCAWGQSDPLYTRYHDTEWGVPCHEDRRLFEFLLLEGAQAGLSWITILKKRRNYRAAFDSFDPDSVSRYGPEKTQALLSNAGIVRNRLKIESAIQNARAFIAVQEAFGSFDAYIWRFCGGRPIANHWQMAGEIPSRTIESTAMAKDLAKRGFKFVGPTICYAFMQAVGMVNDHTTDCYRFEQISEMGRQQMKPQPTLADSSR